MKITCRPLLLLLLLPLVFPLAPALTAAQTPSSDRADVIAAVQGFFDAMNRRDQELARRFLLPDARLYAVTERDGKPAVRPSTGQEFIASLAAAQTVLLERMWEPQIRIQGGIATLWTRYDFHRDGTFSHCGVDAFDLVKMPDGWKIGGLMYTVERTGCPQSPLGPPKGIQN